MSFSSKEPRRDPQSQRQYPLTLSSDGGSHQRSSTLHSAPLRPSTTSTGPRALPLTAAAPNPSNSGLSPGRPQPAGSNGALRSPGSTTLSSGACYGGAYSATSYRPYGQPAQYSYVTTSTTHNLASSIGNLSVNPVDPDAARGGPTRATTSGDIRTSTASNYNAHGYGTDLNNYGSRGQRVYPNSTSVPSVTSGAPRAPSYPYESHVPQASQPTTKLTRTLDEPSKLSPYPASVTSVYAPNVPQQLPYHSPYLQVGQTINAAASFPGQIEVGYRARTTLGQDTTGGQQIAKEANEIGQYRRLSSPPKDETIVDDVSQHLVRGTGELYERLDPRFQVRHDHWDFFKPGRVFKMLSWEPQGSNQPPGPLGTSVQKFGETAFAKVYRYVVVRAKPKQGYSICLRISTYGDRGTAKNLVDQREHSIIYTGDTAPRKLAEEKNLTKDPIQVIALEGHELEELSRVNFAKLYPVEHNVKVLEMGKVAKNDMRTFLGYWQNETEKGFPSKSPERKRASPKSSKTTQDRKKRT